MVYKCHYTFVKTHRRFNATVNYELWMVAMCQCRFINDNKGTTLVRDADSRISRVWQGGDMGVHSVYFPLKFCCEPEAALKNKTHFKKMHNNRKSNSQ